MYNIRSVLLVMILFVSADLQADTGEKTNPLEPFARLVGGEWHLEGSYQVFEWGVGRLSVKVSSYFMVDGEPQLISEGLWFWHPGREKIVGVATAVNMPVVFFDYTTRFEADKVVSELQAFALSGEASDYVETWEFTDDDHYLWTLEAKTDENLTKVMAGTFVRK